MSILFVSIFIVKITIDNNDAAHWQWIQQYTYATFIILDKWFQSWNEKNYDKFLLILNKWHVMIKEKTVEVTDKIQHTHVYGIEGKTVSK